jgi:diguanylate cyclase (GGDEF)-like protein/PAS domain S-box-containing protein
MPALVFRKWAQERDRKKAIGALFSADGGLGAYPGPAAYLGRDGAVIVANDEAARLAALLGFDSGQSLQPDLGLAIRGGVAKSVAIAVGDVSANGAKDRHATFDFTVLPVVPGETALVLGRDTTLELAFRSALGESRQRYKDMVEICGDFCWETDRDGRFIFVSPSGVLGFSPEELIGLPAENFIDPISIDTGGSPFLAAEPVTAVDIWMRRADGRSACLETSARPIAGAGGVRTGARGVCRDVSAERERATESARIQERERQIAHIMRAIRDEFEPDRMLEIAVEATARAVGAAGCRVFRTDAEDALLEAASHGVSPPADEIFASALIRARTDGRPFSVEHGDTTLLCVATSWRHAVNGAVVLWRAADCGLWTSDDCAFVGDVAVHLGVALQQIRYQLELEDLSRTDGLTGLLNRRAFNTELEARMARDGAAGALFYVDLDNFKPVNDLHGHQKGDEALIAVAKMLTAWIRPGDLVARFGGDEFALWLERTNTETAEKRAGDLLAASSILEEFSGAPDRPLGISIGVAVRSRDSSEPLECLTERADAAMYDIKQNGKAGFVIAAGPVDKTEKVVNQ